MTVSLGGEANADEMLWLLEYIESVDWAAVPIANWQLQQAHRGSGPGLGRSTPLAGDYVFFDPWDFRELIREEADDYRNTPREIPEDHQRGFVDAGDYHRTYFGGDLMVDNNPDEPLVAVKDGGGADETVDATANVGGPSAPAPQFFSGLTPAPAVPMYSPAPAVVPNPVPQVVPQVAPHPEMPVVPGAPGGNDPSGVIAQFLREVRLSANEVSGDVAAMWDALANRLGEGPAPGTHGRQ